MHSVSSTVVSPTPTSYKENEVEPVFTIYQALGELYVYLFS